MNLPSECLRPNQIKAIAAKKQTPFYLYSEDNILENLKYVNSCFAWQHDYMNYFPIKDNPNPAILKCLWEEGSGLLACGKAELLLAKRCGFCGHRLMYQPIARDKAAEEIASELSVSWLLTSADYLPECPVDMILLRVYPEQCGLSASDLARIKSGIPMDRLYETLLILKIRNVSQVGLEFGLRAFDLRPQAYVNKAKILLSLLREITHRTGVTITICNLGDGPGYIENSEFDVQQLDEAALCIRELLDNFEGPKPAIHTGLSKHILGRCAVLVTTVIEVRQLQQTYLVLDASYGQFVRPTLLGAEHYISVIRKKRTQPQSRVVRVIGQMPDDLNKLCTSKIVLQVEPGDLCIIHDVGCSAHSMPLLYRFQGICPEYMQRCSGELELIGAGKSEEQVMEFLTTFE